MRLLSLFALSLLLTACGGSSTSGSSPSTAGASINATMVGTAPVAAKSTCELASFPSLQWLQCEAQNFALIVNGTLSVTGDLPQFAQATFDYQAQRLAVILADPARQPNPNLCTIPCPIDPRIQGWTGIVKPVLFTARSGATLSGHIWASTNGPAKRPGIFIINGSVLGYEQVYWYLAQTLAQAGFVVMTFDVQGEGMSDQFGETPDQLEAAFAGTPAVGLLAPVQPSLGGSGLPFYDGGTDALNFFLSTPSNPYVPVASRSTGTSHAAKQASRVAAGLDSAYNPLWQMLDASKIGVSGHSYGAVAASWLGQQDSRITAIVALDSLCVPTWPSADEVTSLATAPVNNIGGVPSLAPLYGLGPNCFGAPAGPAPAITKPALGLNADYFLVPTPYLAPPQAGDKSHSSVLYSQAGVDSGNIVIRGGTHFDFSDAPVIPASRRGPDLIAWYTTAWFAKYLQGNPDADRMLLTARWRNDAATAAADPGGDANMLSWHYQSRLAITRHDGSHFACENLRDGCVGQYLPTQDCAASTAYAFSTVTHATSAAAPVVCSN